MKKDCLQGALLLCCTIGAKAQLEGPEVVLGLCVAEIYRRQHLSITGTIILKKGQYYF